MTKSDKIEIFINLVLMFILAICWTAGLFWAPQDAQQGEVYRIIYLHVPLASAALILCSGALCLNSVVSLVKTKESLLLAGQSWTEIGLLATILTLATGSIWGRPTWGTWWTWDARITTTFLLALLFAAYLLLKHSMQEGKNRIRVCAILGIMIFVDVPIIYKSVTWWRTLHQPASLLATKGQTMSPEMLAVLLPNIGIIMVMSIFLWRFRFKNLLMQKEVEEWTLHSIKQGDVN